ncbi:MAG: hypothetical protein ABIJ34_00720 [archaeon]
MKKYILLVVLIFIISNASASDISKIQERTNEASILIEDFFDSVDRSDILIVTGSEISLEDKILFNLIKSNVNGIQGIEIDTDDNVLEKTEKLDKSLVLIGSKKTNLVSKELNSDLVDMNQTNFSPLIVTTAHTLAGKKILQIFSEKEINNNKNSAGSKSPLAGIIPEKYVPLAATSISLLLLYLWSIIGRTVANIFNDLVSSKVIGRFSKDKKITKKKVHEIKPHEFVNHKEMIAFFVTVVAFAITLSWTWSSDFSEFKNMFFLNLAVVAVISLLRELARLVFCYRNKLRSEYVFWPFGSVLTFVSTFLGNTFSMVSYTLLDEDEIDEKRFGKSVFIISVLTYLVAIATYVFNIISPSLILQMIFVYCIMILFIEMFPLPPMAGADIRKWNLPVWIFSYLLIIISYVYMNFTIYI